MIDVTAEGFSSIVPVENEEGKQVFPQLSSHVRLWAENSQKILAGSTGCRLQP